MNVFLDVINMTLCSGGITADIITTKTMLWMLFKVSPIQTALRESRVVISPGLDSG